MSNYEIIKDAIINKQQILADYKGYYREMCPHVLGTKNGIMHCLFYQFGGQSRSGLSNNPVDNWRCIPINHLTNVSVRNGKWYTATNHKHKQTCVDNIHAEVGY